MKKITWFYLSDCPYCHQARKALDELKRENPEYKKVEIDWVDEQVHPEIADQYDYHAVPCLWIGQQKMYEAHLFETYEECYGKVKAVLEAAVAI
mgnify:CR=1 FL=1